MVLSIIRVPGVDLGPGHFPGNPSLGPSNRPPEKFEIYHVREPAQNQNLS